MISLREWAVTRMQVHRQNGGGVACMMIGSSTQWWYSVITKVYNSAYCLTSHHTSIYITHIDAQYTIDSLLLQQVAYLLLSVFADTGLLYLISLYEKAGVPIARFRYGSSMLWCTIAAQANLLPHPLAHTCGDLVQLSCMERDRSGTGCYGNSPAWWRSCHWWIER